ncbi:MAG: hypothetical protein HY327_04760 [Chloroflexi bacterium]|nr:hypothetical protein [Chloroflexota bacterium]
MFSKPSTPNIQQRSIASMPNSATASNDTLDVYEISTHAPLASKPLSVPRSIIADKALLSIGTILALTQEPDHPTGYVAIHPNGQRTPIAPPLYYAHQDQTLSPNHDFRLVVTPRQVMSYQTSNQQAPGVVAHAEDRKLFSPPAVIDSYGWYGAVVQGGTQILLFESYNSHHQGVAFDSPKWIKRIDNIAWGGGSKEWDLILSMTKIDMSVGIYRLTPLVIYPLPQEVAKHCPPARHHLSDCMMKHYRKMPKQLIPVVEDGDHSAVSVRW